MIIAYLTSEYPAVSHTFIKREIRALEALGHTVHRFAIRPSKSPLVDSDDLAEHGRTHHVLARSPVALCASAIRTLLARPVAAARAAALAARMARSSDRGLLRHTAYLLEAAHLLPHIQRTGATHLHVHFGTNPTAVARLLSVLGGGRPRYSFTVHGPDEFDAPGPLCIAGKVADAAFTVAISSFGASQLMRWSEREHWNRIHVVRCGVDESYLAEPPPPASHSRTLLSVGRLAPQKGHIILLKAFAEARRGVPDARLVIAGDGPLRAELTALAAALQITDAVTFTGAVDAAAVRRLLAECRAFALPSFAEGLPVVIMEALAMARPVISTYVAGIPELVQPGRTGWLTPAGDIPALASAMVEALTAPAEHLQQLGAAGRAAVLERHRVATEASRLAELFRSVSQ